MARNKNNFITEKIQGAIGKEIVFKKINGKSVAAKYPDMSQVEYTKEQLKYRTNFSKAVEFAKEILNDPVKRAEYEKNIRNDKRIRGNSVYHTAVKDFLLKNSQKVNKHTAKATWQKYKQLYALTDREAEAVLYLIKQGHLTNAIYQRINEVSKATATRDIQGLVKRGIIISSEVKGAGACYTLVPLK